jgi:hypothetical protein
LPDARVGYGIRGTKKDRKLMPSPVGFLIFPIILGGGILLSKLTQAKVIATRTVQDCNTNNTNKMKSNKICDIFYIFFS